MIFSKTPKLLEVVILIVILVGGSRSSFAVDRKEGIVNIDFSEDDRYDVYFDYKLVKGAKILGTQEINGEIFLVITTSNLKTKGTQGYIRFASITAILPNGYINALQNSNILYK